MSELLTCAGCHCLVHHTRAIKDVRIKVSIAGEQVARYKGDYCTDCVAKITIPLGAAITRALASDQHS